MSTATGQLAWAEGRRILRNPAVWLSLVPSLLWLRSAHGAGRAEDRLLLLVGYGLLLPSFVMLVATVLAVLRGRLEQTEPLLESLAVGPDQRSVGHAWSALAGGAIGLLLIAAIAITLPARDPLGVWSNDGTPVVVPRPNVAQLLQGPLSIVVLLVMVIALVRWIPTWLVIAPLAFAFMVQGLFLGVFHGVATDAGRWLFPLNTGVVHGEWIGCSPEDPYCRLPVSGFDQDTAWWHAGYLVALSIWLATIAVLRHRRDRATWIWFGASLALVSGFAAGQFATADVYAG
jgi:hypothetical protein